MTTLKSQYLNDDGAVKTSNDNTNRGFYLCYNNKTCSASWTWDDWHCSGCHWKGMGSADLKYGDDALRLRASKLREKLSAA